MIVRLLGTIDIDRNLGYIWCKMFLLALAALDESDVGRYLSLCTEEAAGGSRWVDDWQNQMALRLQETKDLAM